MGEQELQSVLCRVETNWEGWAANMQAGLTARTEDNRSHITKSRVSTGLDWPFCPLSPHPERRTCLGMCGGFLSQDTDGQTLGAEGLGGQPGHHLVSLCEPRSRCFPYYS